MLLKILTRYEGETNVKRQNKNIPFFFDGAFGTYFSQTGNSEMPCELANLYEKDRVYDIHKEYIAVGVDAIKTNTFGANSLLTSDQYRIKEIIQNGYDLAQKAVQGTQVKVFADIGYIHTDEENVVEEYKWITQNFIDCGATYFIFETLAEYEVIIPSIRLIEESVKEPIVVVSFAVSQDGYTKRGHYYKELIAKARENKGIQVVGLNCICGPTHMLELTKNLKLKDEKPFLAMPNSGYPMSMHGRTIFQDNAQYFSGKLKGMAELGVLYLGGCCGTTPEHIGLMINEILNGIEVKKQEENSKSLPDKASIRPNIFKNKLQQGEKVIAVELDPPLDTDCTHIISAAQQLKEAGVDVITIADSPLARTRADSMMLAAKIKREVGVEVLPHLTCRDKNHIGMKGSLIAGNIENINNVLVITGDPIAQTDRGEYKGVFNFNSYHLISFIQSLNTEVFETSPYHIGAAININATNFSSELKRAEKKEEKGAQYFLTQPLFSGESVERLREAKSKLEGKILAGILPIVSYRNALFLNNEVAGIEVPVALMEKIKDKSPEEVREISVEFSKELIHQSLQVADGIYFMTPLKKVELICTLVKETRKIQEQLK